MAVEYFVVVSSVEWTVLDGITSEPSIDEAEEYFVVVSVEWAVLSHVALCILLLLLLLPP